MIKNKMDNTYTINEKERKKILDDINVGIWRIEILPDHLPWFYGDANMYAILGAKPQLQPEQLYQHWHERIEPAYLSYVDKAVERLIKTGQPVEVEYIWNHPQYGKTVVRCDATLSSRQEDGKIVMLGMHRDITDKLVDNIQQESGHHIVDYYKMSLCGKHLIKAYEDIFLIDMETKAIHLIAYRYNHCSSMKDGIPIYDIIDKCVPPEEQKKVYNFFSNESMQKIVAEKVSASIDFRKEVNCGRYKWVRGTLYAVQINGTDELLFVIQNIQNEYQLKIMKEEKEDVLHSVIHERSVIYEYDTKLQQLEILKYDVQNMNRSVASANMPLSELVERLCDYYVDHSEWEKTKAFLSYENIGSCMVGKHKKTVTVPLNQEHFLYAWMKISLLPSGLSKEKVYIVMESIDRQEQLYPILESYIQDTVDYFYYLDLKNDYFLRFIGNSEAYAMPPQEGHNYTQEVIKYADRFVLEEDRELVKKQMSPEFVIETLKNKPEFSFYKSIIGEQGEIRKKLITYRSIDRSRGHALLQRIDVTERYDKEQRMKKAQRESMTDYLTQLYNRLGSETLIKKALAETDENKNAVMILLDLDNFKEVNDLFGHPEGDRILCEAAQKLKDCFRSGDIIGRLGGDEYIVFLPNMLRKTDIHPVLQRVVQELHLVCKNETKSIMVTISAGATFYKGQSYEELYKEADIALYHSKKKKNKYSLFDHME